MGGANSGFNEDGKGYVNISLNLPTQKGTTTRANDNVTNGDADEYKVNNAALLLFAGNSEATAELKGAYDLGTISSNDYENPTQISTQFSKVQEINSVSANEGKIYAFVLVNKGNNITVGTDHSLKINGTDFTGTFKDLSEEKISGDLKSGNLMMTNTPVVSKPGTAAFDDATVLADVTKSIYKTKAEAEKNPAADIFVERLAAKVTLECTDGTSEAKDKITSNDGEAKTFNYELKGWNLANVNASSYLVRQYDNTWNSLTSDGSDFASGADKSAYTANPYRFAGINLIKAKGDNSNPASNKYRTYWGKDANYESEAPFADGETVTDISKANKASVYCYENTFNVAHQDVRNTTCAIVKMKITPDGYEDGTFYTINGSKDAIYSKTNAQTLVANQFISDHKQADLMDTYFSSLKDSETSTYPAGKITAAVDFKDAAGAVQFDKLTLTFTPDAGGATTTCEVTDAATLQTLAKNINVTEYKDGEAYYTILIKHFGDDLTPWTATTKTAGYSYPTPNADANWLGRYGVLRNNWYNLSVTGVSKLGAATPDELDVKDDPTPDDNLKEYISVKINVLSWAKRTQSTVLGE